MNIRYGSICSGIEAATVAWHPLGWAPVFFAEIEPFPCAVLAHHYPDVPNLGDMTTIGGARWRGEIDLLVGGTPCQAWSVAGKRESLADDRGNLTLAFVELIHAIDPAFVVWENVPGVLSTKDNAFGCFLAGLVGHPTPLLPSPKHPKFRNPDHWRRIVCRAEDGRSGHWCEWEDWACSWPNAGMVVGPKRSAAWVVKDAQYFGLAQRRRRVFVVSCRAGDRINPGAILFEPESVRGDHPTREEAGQRVAGTFAARTHGGSGFGTDFESDGGPVAADAIHCEQVSRALTACKTATGRLDPNEMEFIAHTLRAEGFDASEDGTGRGTPIVPVLSPITCRACGETFVDEYATESGLAPAECPKCGEEQPLVPVAYQCQGTNVGEMGTLRAGNGNETGGVPFIPVGFTNRGISTNDIAETARANSHGAIPMVTQPLPFDTTQVTSAKNYSSPKPGDPCHPLAAGANPPAIAFSCKDHGADAGGISPTLRAMTHDGSHANAGGQVAVAFEESQLGCREYAESGTIRANGPGRDPVGTRIRHGMAVRRLSVVECARLMGFPDTFLHSVPMRPRKIDAEEASYLSGHGIACWRDGEQWMTRCPADGPMYRALGNSMATNVMRWIGDRIEKVMQARTEVP